MISLNHFHKKQTLPKLFIFSNQFANETYSRQRIKLSEFKKKNQTVRIIKNEMDYMLKVSVFFLSVCNLYTCSKLLYVF